MDKKGYILAAIILISILGLHVLTLMQFPEPFVDEAFFASRAWEFLKTGRNFGQLDAGLLDNYNGYWTFFPFFPSLIYGFGMQFFHEPMLLPLRIISLFFGLLLLRAIYSIGRTLKDQRYALASVLVTAVSFPFLVSAHFARTDIIVAAVGFSVIALYLKYRSSKFWIGVFSGLLLGIAFEIHPNSSIYMLTIGALIIWESRRKFFRKPYFLGLILGGILGGALYLSLHVLPYHQTYMDLNRIAFAPSHTPPILTFSPRVIVSAVWETFILIYKQYLYYPSLLLVWSVILIIKRRSEPQRKLLVLSAVAIISFIFLIGIKNSYYVILIAPALNLFLAGLLIDILDWNKKNPIPGLLPRIMLWGLCALFIQLNLPLVALLSLFAFWSIFVLTIKNVNYNRLWLILHGGLLIAILILCKRFFPFHASLLIPGLDLLIANLTSPVSAAFKIYRSRAYAFQVLFWAFFCIWLGGNISYLKHDASKDFKFTQDKINSVVKSDEIIMGSELYWFGLQENRYYAWENLVFYHRSFPGSSFKDAINEFRPDIFIIDSHLRYFISDREKFFYDALKLPKAEIEAFLANQARLIAKFQGGVYGQVEVYRIHW